MNDLTKIAPVQTRSVSAVAASNRQASGNKLPAAEPAAMPEVADPQKIQARVEAAVAQMNQFVQSSQRDLHFSYDSASGETVVKVLDRNTQELIRQIPDESFLKLAQLKDSSGYLQLLNAKA